MFLLMFIPIHAHTTSILLSLKVTLTLLFSQLYQGVREGIVPQCTFLLAQTESGSSIRDSKIKTELITKS